MGGLFGGSGQKHQLLPGSLRSQPGRFSGPQSRHETGKRTDRGFLVRGGRVAQRTAVQKSRSQRQVTESRAEAGDVGGADDGAERDQFVGSRLPGRTVLVAAVQGHRIDHQVGRRALLGRDNRLVRSDDRVQQARLERICEVCLVYLLITYILKHSCLFIHSLI